MAKDGLDNRGIVEMYDLQNIELALLLIFVVFCTEAGWLIQNSLRYFDVLDQPLAPNFKPMFLNRLKFGGKILAILTILLFSLFITITSNAANEHEATYNIPKYATKIVYIDY